MKKSFEAMAKREINANNEFVSNLMEQFGLSKADANGVFLLYKKEKIIRLDRGIGRWNLQHGAFWDADVIERAVNMVNGI